MSTLDVPGARLYYETHGSGPLLLMIPGAGGNADGFRMVTDHLTAQYTVLIYDRRGFSRSRLDGPQDYGRRLATDADDVRRLIERVSVEPAIVLGASSGAIVALELLTRHPTVVDALVPFEPPAVRQLPEGQKWVDFFSRLYDLYRTSDIEPALVEFREQTFAESDRLAMARAPKNPANATYWFDHELRQYPAVDLDLDVLAAHADRIVPAVGRESRGYPCYEVNMELGRKVGRDVIELPGGHIGFVTHPEEFALELVQALARYDQGRPSP
ncbi:alpha/beta hydrolase [Rhodococcus opacus]|uniref:alpha/beta fold hydrolase n=1 Tax=Rhodococcus TaxID=1827 RepID=UPI00131FC6C6|nr:MULTISPECIES: alpha/beta hydrolase [Rhodococcus]MDX5961940.1 alpha/beta hydrolase [Rhodococcus opacus]QHE74258.1 abhydrolase, alpha/beta hydrolase fold [Rhodococcus sp. WAY2]